MSHVYISSAVLQTIIVTLNQIYVNILISSTLFFKTQRVLLSYFFENSNFKRRSLREWFVFWITEKFPIKFLENEVIVHIEVPRYDHFQEKSKFIL